MQTDLTPSMRKALEVAASRERGTVCPAVGAKGRLHAGAEETMLNALERRGLIFYAGGLARSVPIISAAGRAALEQP